MMFKSVRCGLVRLSACVGLAIAVTPVTAQGGLETINNPGGGQIVYGPLSMKCTLPVALTTVLRAIHNRFGDRPQIGRLFQAKNSDSVATFFTLTPKAEGSKPVSGLVIVSAPAGALPAAAMIYDDSDRFSKTLNPMMVTLNEAWRPNTAGAASAPASNTQTGAAQPGTAPAQTLTQTPFPDNSGSIGLPAGWHITFARMGGVRAAGPNGELANLGSMITGIYDTNNPRAMRQLQYDARSGRPVLAAPYGGDLVKAYLAIAEQNHRRTNTPAPTLNVKSCNPIDHGPYTTASVLVTGTLDMHDGKGPQTLSMTLASQRPGALGLWTLCLDAVSVPESLAASEWETMKAMVSSWRQDGQVIGAQTQKRIDDIHKIGEIVDRRIAVAHAANDAHNAAVYKQWDNQDKYSKSFQNYQLDQAVIKDTGSGEHHTVDMQGAATLVEAFPDRYQYVQTPDFIKGKDY